MAAIFDLRLIPTSHSIDTGPIVFLDLENVGVAVGISLISCVEAEIYAIVYLLPVMAAIFDLRFTRNRTLLFLVPSCSLTPKMWV